MRGQNRRDSPAREEIALQNQSPGIFLLSRLSPCLRTLPILSPSPCPGTDVHTEHPGGERCPDGPHDGGAVG